MEVSSSCSSDISTATMRIKHEAHVNSHDPLRAV
jgi:hypothetical protein